jgi:translation initiation factor 3 subunit B
MLSKEEQKKIRKELRSYSKRFDEQDANKKNLANRAVIEHRRRLLEEWRAWRARVEEDLREEESALGKTDKGQEVEGEVIEEIVEEIIEETEEIVP